MRSFNFWNKWLLTVSYLTVFFGLMLIVLNQNFSAFQLMNAPVHTVFWGDAPVSNATYSFQQWIYSSLGAVIVGWGVFMTFVSTHAFRNRERWAWNCFVLSILLWYIPDTFLSVYYNVYYNVVINTVFFLAFAIPLIMTRRYFIYFK